MKLYHPLRKVGTTYYIPAPDHPKLFRVAVWNNSEVDYTRLDRGLVFSSPSSAVIVAANMLTEISMKE